MRRASGTLYELGDDEWMVQVTVKGVYTDNGTPYRPSKRVHGTRKDAELALARLQLDNGDVEELEEMTVEDYFLAIYLPRKQTQVREETYLEYESATKKVCQSPFASVPLRQLNRWTYQIEKWVDEQPSQGARVNAYKILRQGLRCARRWGMVDTVATDAVVPPKLEVKSKKVVDSTTMWDYLDAVRGSEIEAGVYIALGCGLRRSEICALDWEAVRTGKISITHGTHTKCGGGLKDEPPKSPKSRRIVEIPSWAMERLDEIAPTSVARIVDGHTENVVQPLMICRGTRMKPDHFTKLWGRLVASAGLPPILLKNLRHSCGTMLVREAGLSLSDVQQILGHESIATTETFYVQASNEAVKRAKSAMDELGRRHADDPLRNVAK